MGGKADIWKCPKCGASVDIGSLGFYSEVVCPNCARHAYIHTQLANFKLEGVLGIGGMSIVLQAKDLILNRPLAIKVLNDTYRDQPERIARFENECAMMARVRHENVVSVYSAGWARGQFYIAMELICGKNLETIVSKEGPMPATRALGITREVVLGLQAANKAGMLHRDMKPGNVIISDEGKAKVLDFGLSLNDKTQDTEEVIWATPYYVPPETLNREQEDVRTDIYALGMTLRFLMTGENVLPGDSNVFSDLITAKRDLSPFSQICPRSLPALCKLVDRMTAYSPADRPASYTALLQELDAVLAQQKEEEEAMKPESLQRLRQLKTAILLGAVALGAGGAALMAKIAMPPPNQVYLEYSEQEVEGALAEVPALLRALRQRNWWTAMEKLEIISAEAHVRPDPTEPTLAAMASLLRAYFSMVTVGSGSEYTYFERLHDHMQRTVDASSAGAELFSELALVDKAISASSPDFSTDGITRPELLGILLTYRSKAYAAAGKPEQSRSAATAAKAEFARANALYSGLGDLLPNFSGNTSDLVWTGHMGRISECFSRHEFDKADNQLEALSRVEGLTEAQRAKVATLKEISQVGRAVVAVVAARRPEGYRAGMSAQDMKDEAFMIDEPGFAQEVYAICLLLAGEYEAAFDANPYKDAPGSTRPFAVIFRGWQKTLSSGK